ncbi:IniB N-terminal domain-containing protein, partial [Agromyces bracchium]
MSNITTALLDFLMGLLRDPEASAEFRADPDSALTNAGLNGICAADVDAVLPVALDFSPVADREYHTGGNSIDSSASGGGWGGGGSGGGWGGGGHGGGGKGGDWGGGGHG